MRRAIIILTLAAVAAGCSGNEGSDEPEERRPVYIEVTNHHTSTMRVVALRSTTRTRLGTVSSMKTDTFEVPDHLLSRRRFRLQAEPVGGFEGHRTEELTFRPGDWVRYIIQQHLPQSSAVIY